MIKTKIQTKRYIQRLNYAYKDINKEIYTKAKQCVQGILYSHVYRFKNKKCDKSKI